MKLGQLKEIMYRSASRARPGGAISTYRWDGLLAHLVTVFERSAAMPNITSSLEMECGTNEAQVCKVRFADDTEEAEVDRWLAHDVGGLTIADLVGVTAWRLERAEKRIVDALAALDSMIHGDSADVEAIERVAAILRGE
jgi:hypothetical protein